MLLEWDHAIQAWSQSYRADWLTALMRFISLVMSGEAAAVWIAIIGMMLIYHHRYQWALALYGGAYLGLSLIPSLKLIFSRLRPLVEGHRLAPTYAFPSGHAMSATIFCGLMAWMASIRDPARKRFYWIIAGLMVFWTGASRVYLGYHWPADVMAGILIGSVYLFVCIHAIRRLLPSFK
jgi:undecaprenyl-diphosphatase